MDFILIEKALENLAKNAWVTTQWEFLGEKTEADIAIKWQNRHQILRVAEVRKQIRKHHIPFLQKKAVNNKKFMIVAERLSPEIKEALIEAAVDWLDAAGNIYLNDDDVFIWIDRNAPIIPSEKIKNRAFKKSGLKVVYLFLQDEKWLAKTYREIAEKAGVSLGNIKYVMDGLAELGYVIPVNNKRKKIAKRNELLDHWLTAFIDELKPKLLRGIFRFRNKDQENRWNELKLSEGTCWGGEPAADIITGNLKPKIFTLYSRIKRADLMKIYEMVPDENGNVIVYEPYWNVTSENPRTAPYLTVYTDLITSGDSRNSALAKNIYERYCTNQTERSQTDPP